MTSEATNSYVTSANLMLFIDLFNEKKEEDRHRGARLVASKSDGY